MSDPGARPDLAARIDDPDSHFPYKENVALRAVDGDDAATQEVHATSAYIKAQEDYLRNPTDETRADERAAASALTEVRQARRILRETPAIVQALEAEIEQADAAQDGTALDAAEQKLTQAIQRAQDAAARLGLHPVNEKPEA
jgi:hypothetical protein